MKKNALFCFFKEKKGHEYYNSKTFSFLIDYVKSHKKSTLFELTKKGPKVVFMSVFSIKEAVFLLKKIYKKTQ